eukprot:793540-Amphidinium_carterae.1
MEQSPHTPERHIRPQAPRFGEGQPAASPSSDSTCGTWGCAVESRSPASPADGVVAGRVHAQTSPLRVRSRGGSNHPVVMMEVIIGEGRLVDILVVVVDLPNLTTLIHPEAAMVGHSDEDLDLPTWIAIQARASTSHDARAIS